MTTPGGARKPRLLWWGRSSHAPGFRTFVANRNICNVLWYGGVAEGAGEGLRSVGAAPTSPIQERVLYLAPRSLFIRPGDPSEVSISRPLAERREMVDVALGTNILGFPKAAYDVGIDGPRTEIVVDGYEDDTYEDVAWQICRALAVLGFRGEVRLFCDAGAEEEEKWEIFASVSHLKGVLHLTDDYAACASGSSKSPRPARSLSELVGVWATMPRS